MYQCRTYTNQTLWPNNCNPLHKLWYVHTIANCMGTRKNKPLQHLQSTGWFWLQQSSKNGELKMYRVWLQLHIQNEQKHMHTFRHSQDIFSTRRHTAIPNEMAQWVKALAAKPHGLGAIPGIPMVGERENQLPQVVLWPPQKATTSAYSYT